MRIRSSCLMKHTVRNAGLATPPDRLHFPSGLSCNFNRHRIRIHVEISPIPSVVAAGGQPVADIAGLGRLPPVVCQGACTTADYRHRRTWRSRRCRAGQRHHSGIPADQCGISGFGSGQEAVCSGGRHCRSGAKDRRHRRHHATEQPQGRTSRTDFGAGAEGGKTGHLGQGAGRICAAKIHARTRRRQQGRLPERPASVDGCPGRPEGGRRPDQPIRCARQNRAGQCGLYPHRLTHGRNRSRHRCRRGPNRQRQSDRPHHRESSPTRQYDDPGADFRGRRTPCASRHARLFHHSGRARPQISGHAQQD